MPTTTSRLSIDVVAGTDLVSSYPTVNAQQMGILDGAVVYSEGVLASRPSAAIKGRIYKGTDTGLYYFDTGSAWDTLMLAAAWANLSLASGLGTFSGTYTPASRVVGDRVELRGGVQNTSGSGKSSPVAICTLASAYRPTSTAYITADTFLGNGFAVEVTTAGVMTLLADASGLINNDFIPLDGLLYSLV